MLAAPGLDVCLLLCYISKGGGCAVIMGVARMQRTEGVDSGTRCVQTHSLRESGIEEIENKKWKIKNKNKNKNKNKTK